MVTTEQPKGFDILAEGDHKLAEIIETLTIRRKFSSGEVLIEQSAEDDHAVYILLKGKARVVLFSRGGHELWLSELGPGALFGEMAALLGAPRSSTVTAMKDGEIALMTGANFTKLMTEHAAFACAVARLQAKRVMMTSRRMFESNALSIPGRVYSELLRTGQPVHGSTERLDIIPPLKVSELARRINASRETVSRAVSDFERQGLLTRAKTHWTLILPEFDGYEGFEPLPKN